MSRPHRLRTAGAALLALVLPLGGQAAPDPEPQEYLDQETAATITVVAQPLVFANARTELAANARDYLTLAAAAVDRSGKVGYVAIAYFWSTVDPRMRTEPLPSPEPLVLLADDRRIELHRRAATPHEAGIGVAVHAPPGPPVSPRVYGVDLATLRFIAEARRLAVATESNGALLGYRLWDDRRPALRAFVRHMGGGG